jgi:protocatechuate 3,4-dioxygenase beta subunit
MLNLFRNILIFGAVFLTVAVFHTAASACMCANRETVDKTLAKTPNVVVAKLQSFKEEENEPTKYFFSVEKIFKGDLKTTEVLTFQVRTSCALQFGKEQVGGEFLFFLGDRPPKDEFWTASSCSRSGAVEARKNDLRYLENEPKLRGKTRLSGRITKLIATLGDFVEHSTLPLANRKIRVVGNGKTTFATTDETGAFELYGLAPGEYKIYPGKLEGFSLFQSVKTDFAEVEIEAKSQTEKDMYFAIDNAIGGKVVDREGKPLKEIYVSLYSVKLENELGFAYKTQTDEDGEFEISAIPEGNYKIVVNGEDPFYRSSRSTLFETFYYPNAETLEKAAEITVGANFFMKNLILVPPAATEMISVTGRVLFADGKPAAEQLVEFVKVEDISKSFIAGLSDNVFEAKTDRNGEFTIKIPKGRKGILRGVFLYVSSPDKSRSCPEIEAMLKDTGVRVLELETNRIEVEKDKVLNSVELKFTFSNCQEN